MKLKILKKSSNITFKELVRIMIDADMETIGLKPIGESNKILDSLIEVIYGIRE